MTNTKGKAPTIDAVCKAFKPPDEISTRARPPSTRPQKMTRIRPAIVFSPAFCPAENRQMTKVAESAEVIKKEAMRILAITAVTL